MHTLKDFLSLSLISCITPQVICRVKPILSRLALILLVFLYGCQSFIEPDVNSSFYKVPSGSKLILHRNLIIPANSLKIYLQDGDLGDGANQYYPFCKFELRQAKGYSQSIKPDQFIITRTRRVVDYFVGLDKRRFVASIHFGSSDNGKPSPMIYGTQMDLRSTTQAHVFRLTCGHLQDPNLTARHLTINQIREALGAVFSLQLPPGQVVN
jgi:hypothetical protein